MREIGPLEEALIRKHLARAQACVDQLQGQEVFIEAMSMIGIKMDPTEVRTAVLNLLQLELDQLVAHTVDTTIPDDIAGTEWLLRKMRP